MYMYIYIYTYIYICIEFYIDISWQRQATALQVSQWLCGPWRARKPGGSHGCDRSDARCLSMILMKLYRNLYILILYIYMIYIYIYMILYIYIYLEVYDICIIIHYNNLLFIILLHSFYRPCGNLCCYVKLPEFKQVNLNL